MQNNTLANILLWSIAIPGWFYIQIAKLIITNPDTLIAVSGAMVGAQLTALATAILLQTQGGN